MCYALRAIGLRREGIGEGCVRSRRRNDTLVSPYGDNKYNLRLANGDPAVARQLHYKGAHRDLRSHNSGAQMAVDSAITRVTRHFERTIRDLETKLTRQQSAVITTLEMIDAIRALRDKEYQLEAANDAKKQPEQAPKRS